MVTVKRRHWDAAVNPLTGTTVAQHAEQTAVAAEGPHTGSSWRKMSNTLPVYK